MISAVIDNEDPKLVKPLVDSDVTAIVREYFPKMSDDNIGYLLWNYTSWPCFWDGEPPLRKQLSDLRDY